MDVRRLDGKTALVTGGASGIGRETALEIARRGGDVFICDVNEKGLEETADRIQALGRRVWARRTDVADATAMAELADFVHGEVDALDLLVNNAGVGLGAFFADTSLEDWRWIVDINLMGVVHGCHFFVPRMVAGGRGGHVVNVSSAAGYTPADMLIAYCTTKYGVLGLSESLRVELAPAGIGVTAICPGIIDTPITATSPLRGALDSEDQRAQMVEMYRRRRYGPARVARNVLRAVQRNRAVAPISPESWALYYLKRLTPGLVRWLSALQSRAARKRLTAG